MEVSPQEIIRAVKAFLCSTSSMPMTTSSNRTVASMYEFP